MQKQRDNSGLVSSKKKMQMEIKQQNVELGWSSVRKHI